MTSIGNFTVKETATLTWPIDAFIQIKTFKTSPDFALPNSEDTFNLELSPNNKLFKRYHVFLNLLYTGIKSELFRYRVSILDAKGQKQYTKEFIWNYIVSDYVNECYNTTNYVPLAICKKFLVNGRLTLYCEVEILDTELDKLSPSKQQQQIECHNNYLALFESGKFSDFSILVGGKQFRVHKNILSTHSPVFAAMFEHDQTQEAKENRVTIEDIEVDVFELMLRYIYTGKIDELDEYAAELFAAADRYQLDYLKSISEQSLISSLDIESVLSVLHLSDMHNAAQLKSKCIEYIIDNWKEVKDTDTWKKEIKAKRADLIEDILDSTL